jgi:accessory gene regulator protein AgrB
LSASKGRKREVAPYFGTHISAFFFAAAAATAGSLSVFAYTPKQHSKQELVEIFKGKKNGKTNR